MHLKHDGALGLYMHNSGFQNAKWMLISIGARLVRHRGSWQERMISVLSKPAQRAVAKALLTLPASALDFREVLFVAENGPPDTKTTEFIRSNWNRFRWSHSGGVATLLEILATREARAAHLQHKRESARANTCQRIFLPGRTN